MSDWGLDPTLIGVFMRQNHQTQKIWDGLVLPGVWFSVGSDPGSDTKPSALQMAWLVMVWMVPGQFRLCLIFVTNMKGRWQWSNPTLKYITTTWFFSSLSVGFWGGSFTICFVFMRGSCPTKSCMWQWRKTCTALKIRETHIYIYI